MQQQQQEEPVESKKRKDRDDEEEDGDTDDGGGKRQKAAGDKAVKKQKKPIALAKIEHDIKIPETEWLMRMQPIMPYINIVLSIHEMGIKDARFHVSSEGFSIKGMDSAHVAHFTASLPAVSFTRCECESEDGCSIGFNVTSVARLCKSILTYNKGGQMSMYRKQGDKSPGFHLVLQMENRIDRFFLHELNMDSEEYNIPMPAVSDCVVTMPGRVFKQHTDDLKKMEADVVHLRASANAGLICHVPSDTGIVSSYTRQIPIGDGVSVVINNELKDAVRLSAKQLHTFTRVGFDDQNVELHMSNDEPFQIVCPLDDKGGVKRYTLCPKIREVDESSTPDM